MSLKNGMLSKRVLGRGLAGLALAIIVVAVTARGFEAWSSDLGAPGYTRAEIAARLESVATFKLIKQRTPEDFERVLSELEAIAKANGRQPTAEEIIDAGERLRESKAEQMFSASADVLKRSVEYQAEIHRQIQEKLGNLACGEFALKGGEAIKNRMNALSYWLLMRKQGQLLLEAIFDQSPGAARRPRASSEDWGRLVQTMRANGVPEAQIDLLANEKHQDPAYCDAMISYLSAAASLPGDSGDRVRATYMFDITKK